MCDVCISLWGGYTVSPNCTHQQERRPRRETGRKEIFGGHLPTGKAKGADCLTGEWIRWHYCQHRGGMANLTSLSKVVSVWNYSLKALQTKVWTSKKKGKKNYTRFQVLKEEEQNCPSCWSSAIHQLPASCQVGVLQGQEAQIWVCSTEEGGCHNHSCCLSNYRHPQIFSCCFLKIKALQWTSP